MKVNITSDEIMPLIKEILSNDREVELVVSGTSMRPFYYHQSTIVTLTGVNGLFKKYDVVLYNDKNKYKLHRIIGFKKDKLVICGDALKEKELVSREKVFGKVKQHKNNNKIIHAHSKRYLTKVFLWYRLYFIRLYLLKLFNYKKRSISDN